MAKHIRIRAPVRAGNILQFFFQAVISETERPLKKALSVKLIKTQNGQRKKYGAVQPVPHWTNLMDLCARKLNQNNNCQYIK